jgi:23S rRNA G2445 N2-methylase RlmL
MLSWNAALENGNYYHAVLEPLFFELLDTRQKRRKAVFNEGGYTQIPYLNGGLFSPQTDDHYRFNAAANGGANGVVAIPDGWFQSLFGVLERYSFTVDENTSYDVELSIDPEMLGRIFENLLAEINPETGESAKKSTGSFYTPRDVVDYMVDASLLHYLLGKTNVAEDKLAALISYGDEDDADCPLTKAEEARVVDALSTLAILDPACGSGAFPIGILQKMVYILQQVDPNARLWAAKQYSSVTSEELKREIKQKEARGLFDYIRKLGVIRESIFGVDIQTIATEIAKLRCFLSLIVEESVEDDEANRGIQPLPNLDFNFITANSLVKLENDTEQSGQMLIFEDQEHIDELKRIRNEYFTADAEDRAELKVEFKDIQRAMFQTTLAKAKTASNRYARLSEWNPFENESTEWFDPEWMFGVKAFGIVIANPPYIHLEHSKELSAYYKKLGFSAYEARGDIYALFYEKGVQLLEDNGFLCYITSNKWMRAAYGQSLRNFFAVHTNPIQLIDFAGQQIFDATVDANILLLSKSANRQATNAVIVKDKNGAANMSVYIKQNSVTVPFTSSDSWAILSPIEQSIKAKIEAVGTPLRDWNVKINYGIKTGCNEAFIVDGATRARLIAADPKSAEIIRPILRGKDIKRYGYTFANQYLIAAHNGYRDDNGNQIPPININDYPAIKAHLDGYWDIISIRTDKGVTPYNLRNCAYMDDFSKQKVIWGEISDKPKFAYDNGEYMQEATTFLMTGSEPKYLLAFLNSQFSMYFFSKIGTTTGVGTVRWKKFKLEEFAIPKPNNERLSKILPLVNKILDSYSPELEQAISRQIYDIFGFTDDELGVIESFQYS